jgi:hypothetical protein
LKASWETNTIADDVDFQDFEAANTLSPQPLLSPVDVVSPAVVLNPVK